MSKFQVGDIIRCMCESCTGSDFVITEITNSAIEVKRISDGLPTTFFSLGSMIKKICSHCYQNKNGKFLNL